MPRSSKEKFAENHELIEATASRLFRDRGSRNVSLRDVMTEVGMTQGGFYRHYASKDALEAAACDYAFRQTAKARAGWISPLTGKRSLDAFVARYLSGTHRDSPAAGCPIAAISTDVARMEPESPLREQFVSGTRDVIAELAAMPELQHAAADDGRRDATAILCLLAGALVISRAAAGDPLSDDVLQEAGSFVKTLLAAPGPRD
ncbi:TetR/AcrR family transcriptional regulator [Noviherbaspirillum galbum]|uniref:TetR/AcrR family transcriptional regulator n=1 Tax=Noviherbaspirillum galbum TaxID=2709383 RepID=A0A6B3SYN8_9BURK|nr:TetR/AcrR family transcriptional regulator [Noviherbaspirillum galbum]NEX64616.1 TetR/AcrR family transcriptional regulator [Noviherbaspirillum galbum]